QTMTRTSQRLVSPAGGAATISSSGRSAATLDMRMPPVGARRRAAGTAPAVGNGPKVPLARARPRPALTWKKHDRPVVLEPWQLELVHAAPWAFLRGCIRSDECVLINRTGRYPYES